MLVSICMITYNHEKYITQAIESVLMQKTNFQSELIIGEDCSKDNTRDICEEYARNKPKKIRLFPSDKNIGMTGNLIRTLSACKGKYIAICEGDDFWTDQYKLQKQVDFMEANPDYGLVYTDINVIDENNDLIYWPPLIENRKRYKSGWVFFNTLSGAFINTLTACFRTELISELKDKKDTWYVGDWWLWLRISMKSKIKYMDIITACYRRHSGNITTHENIISPFNQKKLYYILYDNIQYFLSTNKSTLSKSEKEILLTNVLRLLIRKYGTVNMKIKLFSILLKNILVVPSLFFKRWGKVNFRTDK